MTLTGKRRKIKSFIFFASVLIIVAGCKNNSSSFEEAFLLKTGASVITVGDYIASLEIAKIAYSHSDIKQSGTFRKIQLRLFSQLAEEIIMMEIAHEKNIVISEQELDKAINNVKEDYPEGVFEEMLLENAITFDLWKKNLGRRLLMEKVLDQEIDLKIDITPEVIEAYYKNNKKPVDVEKGENSEEKYSRLIRKIRMDKKQEKYQQWIEKKKKDYSIEVNEKVWEKITEN